MKEMEMAGEVEGDGGTRREMEGDGGRGQIGRGEGGKKDEEGGRRKDERDVEGGNQACYDVSVNARKSSRAFAAHV